MGMLQMRPVWGHCCFFADRCPAQPARKLHDVEVM
jgi:hypothetical protein